MGGQEEKTGARAFVAGGLSGIAFLVAGQPFDTIKVRMQKQARGALYKSSRDCLYKTVTKEGVRALFKGMGTPLCTCIPSSAVYFMGHSHGITTQQWLFGRQEMSVWNHGIAGFWAATYMIFILAPGERIKCLLQLQTGKRTERGQFSGPTDVIRRTLREGGVRQLYKGTLVTGLRDVPGSGLFFVVYESMLRRWGESPAVIGVAGGAAGMAMWFVGVPADVVKTKYQTAPAGTYRSFLQIVPELYRSEGMGAFFKGFGPSGLRAFFANGICLMTYELTIKVWQRLYPTTAVGLHAAY